MVRTKSGWPTKVTGALLLVAGLLVLGTGCRTNDYPLIEQKCGTCHSVDQVYQSRYDEAGWRRVIHGMKTRGLHLTPAEERKIMTILLRDFAVQ